MRSGTRAICGRADTQHQQNEGDKSEHQLDMLAVDLLGKMGKKCDLLFHGYILSFFRETMLIR